MPILSTVVFFKLKVAPPNDIFNFKNISRIFNFLFEFDRYKQIFIAYLKNINIYYFKYNSKIKVVNIKRLNTGPFFLETVQYKKYL